MKAIAVVAMLCAFTISGNAQVQVGMQLGLNFSTLSGMADYMEKSPTIAITVCVICTKSAVKMEACDESISRQLHEN